MRIVEFVGFIVVAIAAFGWLTGQPHTLASVRAGTPDATLPDDPDALP